MKVTNNYVINTTLIVAGNHTTDSDYEFFKEGIRKSANYLQKSSKELQEKRKKWDYILKHGSDNQIMKSYFELN